MQLKLRSPSLLNDISKYLIFTGLEAYYIYKKQEGGGVGAYFREKALTWQQIGDMGVDKASAVNMIRHTDGTIFSVQGCAAPGAVFSV